MKTASAVKPVYIDVFTPQTQELYFNNYVNMGLTK